MTRWRAPALLLLLALALAGPPAAAQRGAAYCNVTEIKSEQLSNGVRVTIVADGEIRWDPGFDRLVAEGAIECWQTQWGTNCMPTERFTRLPMRLFNCRSKLGSGFVAVNRYPVSHVEIYIPEWAEEGVGLQIDVVNYLGWRTGEGDQLTFRYSLNFYPSEDRTRLIVAWTSDVFPPAPPPTTPKDLPSEVEVTSGPAGLNVRAVNAKLTEIANAIAAETGVAISTPADADLRVSLNLHDLPPAQALEAIAKGCGLSAGIRADGSWVLATGVGTSGGYEVAATRRVLLQHLRARDALDLFPGFLLQYVHADPDGNAIIVTGPEWMCERVAADLAKLDAPSPEVTLEVVAVEYTSATALARTLRVGRFLGDFAAAINSLSGELSFLWLGALPREWSLLLDRLEVESSGHLRSRATVRVLNGHTSRIFAGQQRTIIIQRLRQTVEAALETVNIGTTLQLQPRVGEGDEAVLHVTLEMNNLSGTDPTSGLPVVSLRRAEGYARVRQGETIAIAGLEMADESREVRRVPILGSLPLIGGLFRARFRARSETHLAIFITPHIARGEPTSPPATHAEAPAPSLGARPQPALATEGASAHG